MRWAVRTSLRGLSAPCATADSLRNIPICQCTLRDITQARESLGGEDSNLRPLGYRRSDRLLRKYSSLKGLRRLGNLKISHSVLCATAGYRLSAGNSGHKFPTPKNRTVRPYVSKILMGVRLLVGARGFEPPTSRSQTERTTRLCYAPKFANECSIGRAF